jgi:hypothetical protein
VERGFLSVASIGDVAPIAEIWFAPSPMIRSLPGKMKSKKDLSNPSFTYKIYVNKRQKVA